MFFLEPSAETIKTAEEISEKLSKLTTEDTGMI